MKTLVELNSKRYWRFLKVIYLLLTILITIGSFFLFYESYGRYNPKDIQKITENIKRVDSYFQSIRYSVIGLNGDYSSGKLLSLSSKRGGADSTIQFDPNILLYIFSTKEYPGIEGVYKVCIVDSKESCNTAEIDQYSYGKYISQGVDVWVPQYQIDSFTRQINDFSNLKKELDEYKQNGYGWKLISHYNQFSGEQISEYEDYKGITEYLKILFSTIGVLIGIILLTYILESIAHYIILGKFFIKESTLNSLIQKILSK